MRMLQNRIALFAYYFAYNYSVQPICVIPAAKRSIYSLKMWVKV